MAERKNLTSEAVLWSTSTLAPSVTFDTLKTTLTALPSPRDSGSQRATPTSPDYSSIDKAPGEGSLLSINTFPLMYHAKEASAATHVDCPGHADYIRTQSPVLLRWTGTILVVSCFTDGPMPQPVSASCSLVGLACQNHCLHEQVRHGRRRGAAGSSRDGIRELLNEYDFDGDNTPSHPWFCSGKLKSAAPVPTPRYKCIWGLMDAVDNFHIPTCSDRAAGKPFLMPLRTSRPFWPWHHLAGRSLSGVVLPRRRPDEIVVSRRKIMTTTITRPRMFRRAWSSAPGWR